MSIPYTLLQDLVNASEIPVAGTLSRTIYQDEKLKAVLFHFSAGQELSEHTASSPAIMHFLSGEADVTLATERIAAKANTWIHMAPQLPHSIQATTPVVMLLLLLRQPAE